MQHPSDLFLVLCSSFPSVCILPGVACQEAVGQSKSNGACTPPPSLPLHPPPPSAQHSANSSKQKVIHQLSPPDANMFSVMPRLLRFCCAVLFFLCVILCYSKSSVSSTEKDSTERLVYCFLKTQWEDHVRSLLKCRLNSHPLKSYITIYQHLLFICIKLNTFDLLIPLCSICCISVVFPTIFSLPQRFV